MTSRAAPSLRINAPLQALKRWILEQTGLAYYESRDDDFTERIERRMKESGATDPSAYLKLLQSPEAGEVEFDALVAELTIGETYFFRHAEQFAALAKRVLPDLLERRKDTKRLRIWSAGCAIGAEPYSIALSLKRDLGSRLDGWKVVIVATDINRKFLERAREARYGEWSLRGLPDTLRQTCFTRDGDMWVLNREYREQVSFRYHNLVAHPFPSVPHNLFAFDLILCRNVMIYWDAATIARAARQFHDSLSPGGWLFIGHAESNSEFQRLFQRVEVPGAIVYQRGPDAAVTTQAPTLKVVPPPEEQPPSASGSPTPMDPGQEIRELASRGELERASARGAELLAQAKLDAKLHYYCAVVEESRGRVEEAEILLRRALFLDRRFIIAHYQLALMLRRKGDADGAARCFRNALKLVEKARPEEALPAADKLTVEEFTEIARTQLETLDKECSKQKS